MKCGVIGGRGMANDIKHTLSDMADAIKARYRPSEVVEPFVKLKRHGVERVGLCPFHTEKSGSFTVNDRKGIIHCFGCGWSGDLIGFYAEIRNIKPVEAIRILAADAGIDDPIARERLARQSREQAEHRDREQARAKQSDAVKLRNIFAARTPMGGSAVETYLRSRKCWPGVEIPTIGCLNDYPYWHDGKIIGHFPVMVAVMLMPDRSFAGLHMTYLRADGSGKAEVICPDTGEVLPSKKVRTAIGHISGCGIYLTPLRAHMGVAEGIENALTWMIRRPDWGFVAAYSLDNLAGHGLGEGKPRRDVPKRRYPSKEPMMSQPGYRPPWGDEMLAWREAEEVRDISVLADNDSKDPVAARCLFERARRKFSNIGYRSRVIFPPAGKDWNDVIRGEMHEKEA
ncbi:CHC2-type zinc finger protein [Thalassospira sp. 11-3]|nr:CHC2-type zinc finger protein [Thalassospira sp. 11-3]